MADSCFFLSRRLAWIQCDNEFELQPQKESYRPVAQHLLTLYECAWVIVFVRYFLIPKTSRLLRRNDQQCRRCEQRIRCMQVHVEPCSSLRFAVNTARKKTDGERVDCFVTTKRQAGQGPSPQERRDGTRTLGNSNPRSHEMIFGCTFRKRVSLTSRAVRLEAAKQLPSLEIVSFVPDAHSLGTISIHPVDCELGVALRLSSLSIRLGWTCGMSRGTLACRRSLRLPKASSFLPPWRADFSCCVNGKTEKRRVSMQDVITTATWRAKTNRKSITACLYSQNLEIHVDGPLLGSVAILQSNFFLLFLFLAFLFSDLAPFFVVSKTLLCISHERKGTTVRSKECSRFGVSQFQVLIVKWMSNCQNVRVKII